LQPDTVLLAGGWGHWCIRIKQGLKVSEDLGVWGDSQEMSVSDTEDVMPRKAGGTEKGEGFVL